MKITVNGNEVGLDREVTVKELLVLQKVEMPEYVTVSINEEILAREDFDTVTVKDNDAVEFLYFMGGGKL